MACGKPLGLALQRFLFCLGQSGAGGVGEAGDLGFGHAPTID
jgi:hypothetical protein